MGFKSQYPNLKLTIVEAGTQSIRKMLLNGELDLGIIHNADVPDSLAIEHLITSQMVVVASEGSPLSQQETISFSDFFSNTSWLCSSKAIFTESSSTKSAINTGLVQKLHLKLIFFQ